MKSAAARPQMFFQISSCEKKLLLSYKYVFPGFIIFLNPHASCWKYEKYTFCQEEI